jgi:hypothetical protein
MSKNEQSNGRPKKAIRMTKKRTEALPTGSKPTAKPPRPGKDREISAAELELYKKRFGQLY